MIIFLNAAIWALPLALGICAVAIIRRHRHRRRAARKDRAESNYYRTIIEHVSEGILVVDAASGQLIEANPVLLRKLGYSPDEAAALRVSDILTETGSTVPLSRTERPTTLARTTREVMQRARDGSLVSVDVSVTALECAGQPAICYVIRDATPRKVRENGLLQSRSEAERRADYLAHRDPPTGLANRQSFKAELHKTIENGRHDDMLAVLLLDLNDFSSLNDALGPSIGDAVLLEIAKRLQQVTGDRGLLARVGNDEFALALQAAADANTIARTALRLQGALSAPMQCSGYEITVTANVGICLSRVGEADVDTLLSRADMALSAAKSKGRGGMEFFSAQMDEQVRRRLEILVSLRHALERNELTMHYQPIVDVDTRNLIGLEALVRWQHPRLGMIPPREFIAAAEQSELIVPLGERVLRLVCDQIVRWRQSGLAIVPVAVNVSPQQFHWHSVSKLVQRVLAETGVAASDLAIEITESSLMSAADRYAGELQALRAAGVRILVDDFGTGYSSLSYLQHLPIDTLKIDGSFIANVDSNPKDEAIVRAILAMARSLGLKVVAECVESQSQLAVLAKHGCQMAQGYYFGRPMTADKCSAFMRELARRPRFTDTLRLRVCAATADSPRTLVTLER